MNIRDRIKELRRVRASELKANPHNWHDHPEAQRDAMLGILTEIGYADALLARELEDGSLELIDGHLRQDLTPDMEVPVLVLDVDADEAATLLASMDPLAGLAQTNNEELGALLEGVQAEDASLREFLDDLARGIPATPAAETSEDEGPKGPEEMNLRVHEHYDYVVVLARTSHEWNRLAERLGLEKIPIGRRRKLGYGRGFPAAKLLELFEQAESVRPSKPKPTRKTKKKKGG